MKLAAEALEAESEESVGKITAVLAEVLSNVLAWPKEPSSTKRKKRVEDGHQKLDSTILWLQDIRQRNVNPTDNTESSSSENEEHESTVIAPIGRTQGVLNLDGSSKISSSNTKSNNQDGVSGSNEQGEGTSQLIPTEMKELLSILITVLSAPTKKKALQELTGDHAQLMIDFLYSILSRADLPTTWLRKYSIMTLRRLSEISTLHPRWYILKDIEYESHEDVVEGGFCKIYRGVCDNQRLCLKVIRVLRKGQLEDMLRLYAKEAILWGQLRHPNIVPFCGIYYLDNQKSRICLVSPWMDNGNIVMYLKQNPKQPRLPFVYDIAKGLKYLHDESVIHGDLKGVNVLVNNKGHASITDFGLSIIRTDRTLGFTNTPSIVTGYSERWASPELLRESARPDRASDVWAFGCVCFEILTRRRPFDECLNPPQVLWKLLQGHLPAQWIESFAEDLVDHIDPEMWKLIQWCWLADPSQRPTCEIMVRELEELLGLMKQVNPKASDEASDEAIHFPNLKMSKSSVDIDLTQVRHILDQINNRAMISGMPRPSRVEVPAASALDQDLIDILGDVLVTQHKRNALQLLRGDSAQMILDFLHTVVMKSPDALPPQIRTQAFISLYKLSKASSLYPQAYALRDIICSSLEDGGGFCDVYRGRHGEQSLCLKVIRIQQKSDTAMVLKIFAKEAILWSRLHHPNILPFYGICHLGDNGERISLVSPWMENGNLVAFLKRNPFMPRKPFIFDIINGLEYLHSQDIVHGALKGNDVLVNNIGRACIADFGLSTVRTTSGFNESISVSTVYGAAYYHVAPELLELGSSPTKASDVWAFGTVCYEVMTRKLPYHECTNDFQVFQKLFAGITPSRPESNPDSDLDLIGDEMWALMVKCWVRQPDLRPTLREIYLDFESKGLGERHREVQNYDSSETATRFHSTMKKIEEIKTDVAHVRRILCEL